MLTANRGSDALTPGRGRNGLWYSPGIGSSSGIYGHSHIWRNDRKQESRAIIEICQKALFSADSKGKASRSFAPHMHPKSCNDLR